MLHYLTESNLKLKRFSKEIRMDLEKVAQQLGQILTARIIIDGVKTMQIPATLLFVDFSKAFDSVHRGKMEKILLAYGIPKEIVTAIMILYRNTKSMVSWRQNFLIF